MSKEKTNKVIENKEALTLGGVSRSKPIKDNCSLDIEQEKIDRIKDLKNFCDIAIDLNLTQR